MNIKELADILGKSQKEIEEMFQDKDIIDLNLNELR